jgi:hypothetical protein
MKGTSAGPAASPFKQPKAVFGDAERVQAENARAAAQPDLEEKALVVAEGSET